MRRECERERGCECECECERERERECEWECERERECECRMVVPAEHREEHAEVEHRRVDAGDRVVDKAQQRALRLRQPLRA